MTLHLQSMSASCDLALQDATLHEAAGKSMASLRKHWGGLTVFVAHPEIALDNNLAENALRGPVVGRKNYYGSGSMGSGQFAAAMFTVLLDAGSSVGHQCTSVDDRVSPRMRCRARHNRRTCPLFLPWTMTPERLAHFGGRPPVTRGPHKMPPDTS